MEHLIEGMAWFQDKIFLRGFIFGLGALGKIIMLEKQLKESGVLKEQTESDDK